MAFQSRLGGAKWIEPYTDEVLEALPKRGIKKLAVMCPAFVADNLETLEEIGMQGKETFEAAGGERYTLIPVPECAAKLGRQPRSVVPRRRTATQAKRQREDHERSSPGASHHLPRRGDRGSGKSSCRQFLGIPFAQPPVGARRLSPPEPLLPGRHLAAQARPAPPQLSGKASPYAPVGPSTKTVCI